MTAVGFITAVAPAQADESSDTELLANAVPAELLETDGGILLVSDEPLTQQDIDTAAVINGADCSAWYEVCGIVYNRSGRALELRRDATSHLNCSPANPDLRRFLYDGEDSNKIGSPTWPDVDCFRHNISGCTIFYRGLSWSAGSWIRIYNSVWVYNLNC